MHFKNGLDTQSSHLFSLKKIYFPTGGAQEFYYEPHEYIHNSSVVKGGGIRLSRVKTYDNNGMFHEKIYKYGENENRIGIPSFNLTHETFADFKTNRLQYIVSAGINEYVSYATRIYSPVALGDANISQNYNVEYPQISVYNTLESGYSKVTYSFNLIQPVAIDVMPENSNYQFVGSVDLLNNRGHKLYINGYQYGFKSTIASSKYYDSNGVLVKQEDYDYNKIFGKQFNGGIKLEQVVIPTYIVSDFMSMIEWSRPSLFKFMFYSIISGRDLLARKRTREYFNNGVVDSEESYVYDEKFQSKTVVQSSANGTGDCKVKHIKYPYNFSDGVNTLMVNRNMLNYPIETFIEFNTSEIYRERTTYGLFDNKILPAFVDISYSGLGGLKREVTYTLYDKKANLLEYITKDNNYVSFIWGYNYQYPIAQIQGVSYAAVKTALGQQNVSDNNMSYLQQFGNQRLEEELNIKLRSAFKNHPVQIKTFFYKPFVGVTAITELNGFTTKYDYDQFGRLKECYFEDSGLKRLMQKFRYNYKLW